MLTISDHELQVLAAVWARFSAALGMSAGTLRAGASLPVEPAPDESPAHLFEEVARRWHAHMRPRWTKQHGEEVIGSLERDIFLELGEMPLAAITPPIALKALRAIEERGSVETARRVRQRISAVFAFAAAEGIADHDPAAIVGKAMAPAAPVRRQPALLTIEDARSLLAASEHVRAAPVIKSASRFLALTAVRLAAVRRACWSEIEDLDGAAPMWRIPAEHMKLAAAKKKVTTNCHLVPLSSQAVAVLRALDAKREPLSRIFAGVDGAPIGESAIGSLYNRAGYAGRHVPHGWRSTFSTIMNERHPDDRAVIDLALAHAPKDRVESAYNRAAHLERRRRVFQIWGDLLVPDRSGASEAAIVE